MPKIDSGSKPHPARGTPRAEEAKAPKKAGSEKKSDQAQSSKAADRFEAAGSAGGGSELSSYVRQALLEAHRPLIAQSPEGARTKFEKLVTSPFVFFRGTADLFFRDLAGVDSKLPKVLCDGDVHPENFGVIEGPDGALSFGLNDFDEATRAPFSWDVKRGATAFELAARERKFQGRDREQILKAFVDGYFDALKDARGTRLEDQPITAKDSPKVIQKLLAKAEKQGRAEFLSARVSKGRFVDSAEIKPLHGSVGKFQKAIDAYARSLGSGTAGESFKVKDVARKLDSGTASLGMERYYVLIEGKTKSGADDVILEIKEEKASVAAPYAKAQERFASEAERVVAAQQLLSNAGDRFFGATQLDGRSFLVRERNPHKAGIELASLSAKEMGEYARVCGKALAQAHARSDGKAEKKILEATKTDAFSDEVLRFASRQGDRVTEQYQAFKSGWQKGQYGLKAED